MSHVKQHEKMKHEEHVSFNQKGVLFIILTCLLTRFEHPGCISQWKKKWLILLSIYSDMVVVLEYWPVATYFDLLTNKFMEPFQSKKKELEI